MSACEDIIIIGGGEHAKVVAEAILLQPSRWNLVAVVDVGNPRLAARHGVTWMRDDDEVRSSFPHALAVLGIGQVGSGGVRRDVAQRYNSWGTRWATVVHPAAVISPSANLGEGTVVMPGSVVHGDACIGCHTIINTSSVIEHDVRIGDFAVVCPGAIIGGGTTIGDGTFLGLGCRIRDHISVGANAMVAMGAVVVGNVPDHACVAGVPALQKPPSSRR